MPSSRNALFLIAAVALIAVSFQYRRYIVREIDFRRLTVTRSSKKKQGNARKDGVPTVQQIW